MVWGWRIKSVELNSCHCSDSSRAERRGSERDSEQRTAGTERASERAKEGEREREGEARRDARGRPVPERTRGAGHCGAEPRPSQHRSAWNPTGTVPPARSGLLDRRSLPCPKSSVRVAGKLRRRVGHRKFILGLLF